jgi:3-oxoacyl-[acyl-carrier-protein] synthase-3
VQARTGIGTLRRLRPNDTLAEHAVAAAAGALEKADLHARDVDLLLLATCSGNRNPGAPLSSRVAAALGLRAAHLDLNAACSGFCYALAAADSAIRTGAARHVLVVGAESMSELVDAADLGTSIIFGDGAGASVISAAADDVSGIGPVVWGSDGGAADLISCAEHEDGRLEMRGREVFRWAVETVPGLAREACARAGVTIEDVDVFVPHQANLRIVQATARALELRPDAVIADDIIGSGNTSAASIPLALDRIFEQRQAKPQALALLVGFGAGLAYAAQVIRLP